MVGRRSEVAGWRSERGRRAFYRAYDAAMSLWPVPFESLQVPTRYGSTHVVASGPRDAPPMVLLHAATGFGSTQWHDNVAAWSLNRRVYALDFIGSAGKGTQTRPLLTRADCRDWLLDVLTSLELAKTDLVGSSQGGWLALNMAVQIPSRVSALALLAPAACFVPIRPLLRLSIRAGPFMPAWTGPPSIRALVGGRTRIDDRIVRVLTLHLRHFRYQPKAVFPGALPRTELEAFDVPTLLMIGEREMIYDPEAVLALARTLLLDIETELVPDTGHLINMESPALTTERVIRFLRAHSSLEGHRRFDVTTTPKA